MWARYTPVPRTKWGNVNKPLGSFLYRLIQIEVILF